MKRLIVCCDGTWLDSASGLMRGKIPLPSNVTRIAQAVKPISQDGINQVVYYQAGIGSTGSLYTKVIGGATAEGLSENIRSAYTFLANNYADGDEIFLFGFSRGAFTVRSIAGLIDGAGLLTKNGLPYLAEVFKDVENAHNGSYRPANPNIPFPRKPSADNPKYKRELRKRGLSRLDVPIKAVGVWDTVGTFAAAQCTQLRILLNETGSLGIPRISWLEKLHLQTRSTKEYLFYDTKLNDHILNAFQALALDEHRSSFTPAVWEKPQGNTTNLRQVWFPGVHQNIGGGYPDQGMSNITLAWMMSQVEAFIDFNDEYILDQYDATMDHYKKEGERPRPWSFGKIYRSMIGIYLLGGRTARTPGRYNAIDPQTGEPESRPLRDTCEYVHPSVRTRIKLRGPGVEDEGRYDAHPLDDYKLKYSDDGARTMIWQPRRGVKGVILPESPLYRSERELLYEDPRMYEYLIEAPPEESTPTRMSGALTQNSPRQRQGSPQS